MLLDLVLIATHWTTNRSFIWRYIASFGEMCVNLFNDVLQLAAQKVDPENSPIFVKKKCLIGTTWCKL